MHVPAAMDFKCNQSSVLIEQMDPCSVCIRAKNTSVAALKKNYTSISVFVLYGDWFVILGPESGFSLLEMGSYGFACAISIYELGMQQKWALGFPHWIL